jgi:zinc protease
MKNIFTALIILLFSQFNYVFLLAQTNTRYADLKNHDTIPLDPRISQGKLSNGFTYYLFKSNNPEDKVVMNLVVKAGYGNERADQVEASHLLEHMAFRETRHFKTPVDFFEKHGLRYGIEIAGSTGAIRTVYKLVLPSQNTDLIQNGLLFFKDCAQGLLLTPDRIDRERGAVLEEIRRRDDSDSKIRAELNKKILGKSKYNNRSASERMERIKKMTEKPIVDFYEKWYRPSLEAVIVAGYIDTADIKAQIQVLFSDLKDTYPSVKPVVAPDPAFVRDKCITVIHPELERTEVRLYGKNRHFGPRIMINDVRSYLIEELSSLLVNARFNDVEERNQGGYEFSYYVEILDEKTEAPVISITGDSGVANAVRNVLIELERVRRYGFTKEEIAHAKALFLKFHDADNTAGPKEIASDLVAYFTEGKAAPGKAFTYEMIRDLFEKITPEDLQNVANNWNSFEEGLGLVVLAPEGSNAVPDQSTVAKWLTEIKKNKVEPYRQSVDHGKELLSREKLAALAGSSTVSQSEIAKIGVTRFRLSNGVQVLLKPLKTVEKKINLQALASGGSSFYEGSVFPSAFYAANIVSQSGLSSLTPAEFKNFLNMKGIQVYPFIAPLERGIKGVSDSMSVEILLQAVNLYFAEPKLDMNSFNTFLFSQRRKIAEDSNSPDQIFYSTISSAINNTNLTTRMDSPEALSRIDPKKAFDIYRECFRDASQFTFVIAGDFEISTIKPLIEKYLGSLPTGGGSPVVNKVKVNRLKPNTDTRIFARKENLATVQLRFFGEHAFNTRNNLELDILANALQMVLMDRLRHQEGGTYFVSASASYSKAPVSSYGIGIGFDCDPTNVDKMIGLTLEELTKIKTEGFSGDVFSKAIALQNNDFKMRMKKPSFWCTYLCNQVKNNDKLTDVNKQAELIEKAELSAIKKAARKYLRRDSMMRFVLMPKKELLQNRHIK